MERFCVGLDVSAKTFDIAFRVGKGRVEWQTFENDGVGHRGLVKYLKKRWKLIRVVMESTGIYGLELALATAGAFSQRQVLWERRESRLLRFPRFPQHFRLDDQRSISSAFGTFSPAGGGGSFRGG